MFKIFHFGGDEVAHGAWTKSPACKRLAQKLGLNFTSPTIVKDLKEYFVRRVSEVSHRFSKVLLCSRRGLCLYSKQI